MNDKNVTLDRIEFEKLIEQSKAERAEYMRQCGTAALGVVGSTLRAHHVIAVVAVLLISFGVKMFFLPRLQLPKRTYAPFRVSSRVPA